MNPHTPQQPARIGVLGGTFDPVHIGHLRLAIEAREALDLDEVRLIPCARPPHRDQPDASPEQRLAMLRLAVEGDAGLVADDRELVRPGLSYTVDTLQSLRDELGPQAEVILLVGSDAFRQLETWHCWGRIPELARLGVVVRAGFGDDDLVQSLPANLRSLFAGEDRAANAMLVEVPLLEVSATRCRALLASGASARHLLPQSVLEYLNTHALYQGDEPENRPGSGIN